MKNRPPEHKICPSDRYQSYRDEKSKLSARRGKTFTLKKYRENSGCGSTIILHVPLITRSNTQSFVAF